MNYIGIDCEWVNKEGQVNAPVALLQIATPLCDCFLVRLCKMDGQIPQTVKEILEDKTVLKFGVGIQDDAKRLWKMFGVRVQGCVDLRHVIQRSQLENEYQRFLICSLSEGIRKYGKHSCVSCTFSVRFWVPNQGCSLSTRPFCLGVNECTIWDHKSDPLLVLSSDSFFVLLEKRNSNNY